MDDPSYVKDCVERTHKLMKFYGINNGDEIYRELIEAVQSALVVKTNT